METEFPPKIKEGCSLICAAITLAASALSAAEPRPQAGEMPRIKPLEPAAALSSFQVRPGFEMELVAAEPMVADPMAIAFDERGRLYVVEMHGYPEKRHEKIGQVKLLTDTDGDGVFDKHSVFAKDLGWPSAVIAYDGGVFIGCAPNIYFMKDTDGDGIADEKNTVFTGFRTGSPREIAPRLFNSFRWGYDNRIYGASSMNGGIVRRSDQPESKAVDLTRHDFSFDPKTLDLRPESGTAQHGMSFDLRGTRFVSRNSNHLQAYLYDYRYANRNPHYTMPHWRKDIAVEGPAAKVYRISPPEPWRILRTRWRVGGEISGPVEGGGTAFGYFTSATGVTIYRGDAYPESFIGNAFIGAPANNLIHRKTITYEGAEPVARRAEPDRRAEFIASTDNWFRPVAFMNGPDGCLYVADMYRETIEVAHAIPESIKAHLDIYSGTDRGRIYRIAPADIKKRSLTKFANLNSRQLVNLLRHPNGWHRDNAARLVFERNSADAVPFLRQTLTAEAPGPAKIHALYLLDDLDALRTDDLVNLIGAPNRSAHRTTVPPAVQEHALRLLAPRLNEHPAEELWARLRRLAYFDGDPRTLLQLAFTLGNLNSEKATSVLGYLARHSKDDPLINSAILSSVGGRLDRFLMESMVGHVHDTNVLVLTEVNAQAIELIGRTKNPSGMEFVARLLNSNLPTNKYGMLLALGKGLRRAKSDFSVIKVNEGRGDLDPPKIIAGLLKQAANDAIAPPLSVRTNAIACLAFSKFSDVDQILFDALKPSQPMAVQVAALKSLDQFSSTTIADQILQRWNTFTPSVRDEAIRIMLRRTAYTIALLKKIEQGSISREAIPFNRRNSLRRHRDPAVQSAVRRVFAVTSTGSGKEAVTRLRPALSLPGRPANGRRTYEERCQTCHRFRGHGYALGPDLETIRAWTAEEILLHILDPNLKVEPNQRGYTVDTKDDESYTGLIISESASGITLRMPNGLQQQIARSDISEIRNSGLSIMPVGLEENLDAQGMADLIAFLKN